MSTTKRIWIVSELYYPEETSTGYIVTGIAEGLADSFEVHALCGQPSYSARGVRAPRVQEHNGVRIRRCSATTFNKNILPLRLLNLITISLSLFFHAIWSFQKYDFVLTVTNPPLLPFLSALACWLRGAEFLLLVHDVYPDILIATKILRVDSLPARFGVRMNQWLYHRAARIIVLGRDMQARARLHLNPSQYSRIVVIPNWADVDQITPQPRVQNELLVELGLTRKFVVQYAGNMGYPNDLESIVESAHLLAANPDVHFLFLGSGVKWKWVKTKLAEYGLHNATLLGSRPRSQQQIFLNACDVAIVSLIHEMVGISVPSRMYNILAAGKPIIAVTEVDSELAQLVLEEQIGWVVSPGAPEKIVEVIVAAYADSQGVAKMGQRARCVAESKYAFQQAREKYRALMVGLDEHGT